MCIKPLICTIYQASSKALPISWCHGNDIGTGRRTKSLFLHLPPFNQAKLFPSQMIADCWSSALYEKKAVSHTKACLFPTDDSKCTEQIAALCLCVQYEPCQAYHQHILTHNSPQAPHSFPVFILLHPKNAYCLLGRQKKIGLKQESFLCNIQASTSVNKAW